MQRGQLPAPCPSGQSEPSQTKMEQRCVPQDTCAALPCRPPARFGVQGGKAVRACDSRPASPKNAIIVMNNFLASGGICTPHPFWAVSLFLETVFLGI